MPKKRHTPEEIVAKLRQVDVLTSQGKTSAEAIRSIGVASRSKRCPRSSPRGEPRFRRGRSGQKRHRRRSPPNLSWRKFGCAEAPGRGDRGSHQSTWCPETLKRSWIVFGPNYGLSGKPTFAKDPDLGSWLSRSVIQAMAHRDGIVDPTISRSAILRRTAGPPPTTGPVRGALATRKPDRLTFHHRSRRPGRSRRDVTPLSMAASW